jgi:hypothetical protein
MLDSHTIIYTNLKKLIKRIWGENILASMSKLRSLNSSLPTATACFSKRSDRFMDLFRLFPFSRRESSSTIFLSHVQLNTWHASDESEIPRQDPSHPSYLVGHSVVGIGLIAGEFKRPSLIGYV